VAGLAFGVLAGVIAGVTLVDRRSDAATRRRMREFLAAVEPLAHDGGRVVQLGLKPSIATLQHSTRPEPELVRDAAGWDSELREIGRKWRAAPVPGPLREANAKFLAALDGYAATAIRLRDAANAGADQREALVRAAINSGEAADGTWDDAASLAAPRLRAAGVSVPSWFP
jgi:hypothetical protein